MCRGEESRLGYRYQDHCDPAAAREAHHRAQVAAERGGVELAQKVVAPVAQDQELRLHLLEHPRHAREPLRAHLAGHAG